MKIPICVLCAICGLILLSGCATPKPPEKPSVAHVRESFSRIDELTNELETELAKKP